MAQKALLHLVPRTHPGRPIPFVGWSTRHLFINSAAIAICLFVAACGAPANQVSESQALINQLQMAEFHVVHGGEIRHDFLSIPGRTILVNGEQVELFEYASRAAATTDSHHIDKDACLVHTPTGNFMEEWPGTPHLYLKDRLMVIYMGTTPAIEAFLVSHLGAQFAGK